jgi:hypothetical protein
VELLALRPLETLTSSSFLEKEKELESFSPRDETNLSLTELGEAWFPKMLASDPRGDVLGGVAAGTVRKMAFAELRTASSSPSLYALPDLINANLIRPAHKGVESMLSSPLGMPLLLSRPARSESSSSTRIRDPAAVAEGSIV